jgi:hypothetical protein
MSQPSFFDVPRARNSIRHGKLIRDPDESFEAARSLSDEYMSRLQEIILAALRIRGPQTDEELVAYIQGAYDDMGPSEQNIRSRRAELVRRGLVAPTRQNGLSSRGRPCSIWRAV